jgi:AcrR family transcriptional regulator
MSSQEATALADPAVAAETVDSPEAFRDGRRKRGEDNRNRISDAFIAMVSEGTIAPTAKDVAQRANVASRSVFRHFSDMESLYREMTMHIARLSYAKLVQPLVATDSDSAITELIERRCRIYDQLMPFHVAAQAHQHVSAHLSIHLQDFAELQRRTLLKQLPRELVKDKARLEAANLALSFDTWMRLRREQRLGREAAKHVIALTCAALLASGALTNARVAAATAPRGSRARTVAEGSGNTR